MNSCCFIQTLPTEETIGSRKIGHNSGSLRNIYNILMSKWPLQSYPITASMPCLKPSKANQVAPKIYPPLIVFKFLLLKTSRIYRDPNTWILATGEGTSVSPFKRDLNHACTPNSSRTAFNFIWVCLV